ncbi:MAG TPA: 5'-nucleotidase, lipoprotein e(P4) family [Pyrinomonadaceae bacterium]|nr:5'-nucleotidase, lipoprotein e(P4) family [Pyrinomonadaceae bacterium]
MNSKKYLLSFGLIVSSVVSTYFVTVSTTAQQAVRPAPATADNEYQVGAILYMQKAAEYRAMAYQAYNIARWRLDADFEKKNLKELPKVERKKPRAVMVDIDETVLDNSPANAFLVKNRRPFNTTDWYAWGEKRKAKPIPGAVDFLNYANSRGVRIFFVSNRDEVQKQATIDNLKSAGFANISAENVLLRNGNSSKEPRREQILAKYRIVFSMGDNLDDHSVAFENRSVAERFAEVDKAKDLFGKKYILLPNAMYGTWENVLYDKGMTDAQKVQRREELLELP